MTLQSRLVQAGLGKQTAQGTPATAPTTRFGVLGGHIVTTEVTENELNPTWSTRLTEGFERVMVIPGADFEVVCTPGLTGQLLMAALGADAVTGTGPYAHILTPADTVPYFTVFGNEAANYLDVQDSRLSTLELSFDRVSAWKAKTKWMGCGLNLLSAAWTAPADERPAGGYLNGGGGTFTFDSLTAIVQSGAVTIDNHVEPVGAAFQATPADVYAAHLSVGGTMKIIPADLGAWKEHIFGSATASTGATISPTPYYGTFEWLAKGPSGSSLTFNPPLAKFMVAFPEAKPAGGPVELEVAWQIAAAVSGTPVSFTLIDSVATY